MKIEISTSKSGPKNNILNMNVLTNLLIRFFFIISTILFVNCTGAITDQDGNRYKTIKIGKQVWMSENLNVSTFRNGNPIPEIQSEEEWIKAGEEGIPAWCYYNNDPENGRKYGKLYNGFAVSDPRGIAPEGFHIPDDEEWIQLADFLGGASNAGTKLKHKRGWEMKGNGTNKSRFTALPGGYRYKNGKFDFVGYYGYWWASGKPDENVSWGRGLGFDYEDIYKDYLLYGGGFSIRCLKD